jgi:predicted HicB family RNase H-like nuclease
MSAKRKGADAQNLLRAFQRSPDVPRGATPEPVTAPVAGERKVNVALGEGLHLEVKLLAARRRVTVQSLVNDVLREYVDRQPT